MIILIIRYWNDLTPVWSVLGFHIGSYLFQSLTEPLMAATIYFFRRQSTVSVVVPQHGPVAHVELQPGLRDPEAVIDVSTPARSSEGRVQKTHCFQCVSRYEHTGAVYPVYFDLSIFGLIAVRPNIYSSFMNPGALSRSSSRRRTSFPIDTSPGTTTWIT